jgi:3'-phosphoadenosine 5'-phosphosulfate sulfotransferase (PAPS reductase)/FAD synthetase
MTALVRLQRAAWGLPPNGLGGRPVRILNVLGLRAEESTDRARLADFAADSASSNGKRHVDRWLPIHSWTTRQVWSRIAEAGTRHHWAYDLGMSRLSCRFCVLASRADLLVSARENPDLAAEYAAVESRIGHRFQSRLSMADLNATVAAS